MKKIFYLLLLTAITLQAQTTGVNKLKIAANPEKTTAPRVIVQETNGDVGYVAKSSFETAIPTGTISQYWRGDKTWQTLPSGGIWGGITGSMANQTDLQSAFNLKANIASPTFTGTVSGITKAMVGLSNVDNTTDANKPVSTATQTALNLKENTSNKNIANGYAGLGADGKLISNQLPAIAITDTYVVNTQASMLALTAETGDVAIRTDLNKTFILQGATASVLGNWQELLSPTGGATSVFGRTGSVVANAGDYNTSQVTENTNLYYTDARVSANANVAANSAARNSAATIGTANGLSLSGQQLSLGLSSASSNGALSSSDWTTFNNKEPYISPTGSTGQYWRGNKTWGTLDTSVVPENTSLYFTNNRARSSLSFSAGSGDYNSTTGVITIPTNTNQLTNGAGFITGSYLPLSGGTVSGNITANAFFASSDRRLKNIISRSGDMIEFTWKDKRDNKTHFGYVAQEVRKKMPDQVNRDEQGYMSVNYIEVLVAKVNALELEVQSLKEKLK